ncbi:MAG TPA: DUF3443 domain-containing protein [Candidatus Angelobacter sp.]
MRKHVLVAAFVFFTIAIFGCGGVSNSNSGSGGNPIAGAANNVLGITAGGGPAGIANALLASVVICVPGSSNCATVDGVLVDTGSSGLRVLSSALPAGFALPRQASVVNGSPVGECFQFVDGFTWGPVAIADVHLSGEQAGGIPVQIIGEPGFAPIPASCTATGPSEQTVQTLGANGILGVGNFLQDCGPACALQSAGNPGIYFTCPNSVCTVTPQSLPQQVQNPVAMFASDNNGVIIELPAIAATGAPSVSGSLVFGIGTQSNNGLNGAKVLKLNGAGNFTTVINNQSLPRSFVDSGSNGLFFLSSATTGMPVCSGNPFYCPAATQNFTAVNTGTNGASTTINFTVANANTLFSTSGDFLFNNLAAPNPASSFDWGMPFFYGRNVFTAFETRNTPGGPGPYTAY